MSISALPRMDADTFIAWAMEQPETGHYELHDGDIVSIPPERVRHGLGKVTMLRRMGNGADRFPTIVLGDQPIILDPPGILLENIFV